MQEVKTIGVVGYRGMVGKVVYEWFKKQGYEIYGYSKSDRENEQKVNNADVIFICVPTPFDWNSDNFDGSIVETALRSITDGKIVVIKSTVPIGTTEKLQAQFPKLKLLFNPEFLSEATAYGDFVNPDRQFVGYTKESFNVSILVMNLLPESAHEVILPVKEAELLKYINNLHGTLAVIEANHYYDICQLEGLDYERVITASHASKWIGVPMGRHYHKVNHKGFRGFGGKCFPKDINAWLKYTEKLGVDDRLFRAVRDINKDILKNQNLTQQQAEER